MALISSNMIWRLRTHSARYLACSLPISGMAWVRGRRSRAGCLSRHAPLRGVSISSSPSSSMKGPMRARDDRRERLCRRVESWARRLRVEPRLVRVQHMTRKWGSCSTSGIITRAADLADQDPGFQDFVIAHELLHLRVPNHGRLFKALMSAHLPGWREYDVRRLQISGAV